MTVPLVVVSSIGSSWHDQPRAVAAETRDAAIPREPLTGSQERRRPWCPRSWIEIGPAGPIERWSGATDPDSS